MTLPFTPKFVDLVRTLTMTQGLGPIIPGAAVRGFSGFAETLQPGDQFYYCMQSVERPDEREIGRGTLADDGSIARDPLNGEPTAFSPGAKTVALVAAAEWFEKQESAARLGGGGSSGEATIVRDRVTLGGLPTEAGAAMLLSEQGREGLFVFTEADLRALVFADKRQGLCIPPASDPSGASGAWLRRFEGPVNLMWFGAAADFVTDDLPAMQAALAVIKQRGTPNGYGGDRLYLPAGRYYFSSTVDVHCPVHIMGAGSAQNSNAISTVIRFGKNCNGFVFNHDNTHGDGLGTQGLASSSTLEGISLWGGNVDVNGTGTVTSYAAGNSTTGHGVRIRTTFVRLLDVFAGFFGGDGFHMNCTAGSGGYAEGNANSFYFANCQAQYNRGSGFLAAGTDANAGTVNSCSAISNGECGFKDYSFLGNSYVQCHARDNGVFDPVRSGGPTGTCKHGSDYFYVVAGQEGAASTTTPGTNENVWRRFSGNPDCKTWVSGATWAVGSPYATNPANVNARNILLGCYAEGSQAPVQATYPTLILGGLLDEVQVVGSAPWLTGGQNTLQGPAFQTQPVSNRFGFLGDAQNGRVMTGYFDGSYTWRWGLKTNGDFCLNINNSDNPIIAVPVSIGAYSFPVQLRTPIISDGNGDVGNGRAVVYGTAAPTTGLHLQGEIVFNSAASSGGHAGWICTSTGTPGTWKTFGAIAA